MTTTSPLRPERQHRSRRRREWCRRHLKGLLGGGLLMFVLAIAIAGRYVAPNDPNAILGRPYTTPNGTYFLGLDSVGRDVLSRVLYGGRLIVVLSFVATALAYLVATPIGLYVGYRRSRTSATIVGVLDVFLAVPPILLLLVLTSSLDTTEIAILAALVVAFVPSLVRVVRAASLEVGVKSFVDAARVRGEPTTSILFREILPNITPTLIADFGLRLTLAMLGVAAVNFIGLGVDAPTADWGKMVFENQPGLATNPWCVLVPATAIAALTVAVNLVGDHLVRRTGRTSVAPQVLPVLPPTTVGADV